MSEIEKLLAEIEKKFSVPWGFSSSGRRPDSHFVQTGKGITISPEEWRGFKEKWFKRSNQHTG